MKNILLLASLLACFASHAHADSSSFGTSRKLKMRTGSDAHAVSQKSVEGDDASTSHAQLDTAQLSEETAPKFGVNKKLAARSSNRVNSLHAATEDTETRAQLDVEQAANESDNQPTHFGAGRKVSQRVNSGK